MSVPLRAPDFLTPSAAEPARASDVDVAAGGRNARAASVLLRFVAPVIGVVGFLGLWQALIAIFDVKQFELPTPWRIIDHLGSDPSYYFEAAKITLWEAAIGFMLGIVVGLVLATAMAQSRFVERAVMPLVVLVQVTPIIAYAPAFIIWLNFGLKPIVVMTTIVCSIPFIVNATLGLRSVDPNLLELAHSVDASRTEIFFRLRVPSSLPYLFTAGRIAVGLALIGATLGEFFAGTRRGLGYAIKVGQTRNLALQVWGSVYVLAFIGAVAILLISTIERFVLHWHASQRR